MPLNPDAIAALLIDEVPRDLVMGVEDAFAAGALQAYAMTKDVRKQRKVALGYMRHIEMNERFSDLLEAANAELVPVQGNRVIVGKAGIFKFTRLNMTTTNWNHASRSTIRRELADANQAISELAQLSLFESQKVEGGAFFFVARFSGSLHHQPEKPLQIYIAVPTPKMDGWLFREPLAQFLERYDAAPKQIDNVTVTLKTNLIDRGEQEET
ncbi:hypothetical protein BK653_09735 [Pseudomonas brassicacearum]|uniref:hypothetical protein n=1 Tax=Pseudomonas brassicacearum TaxID=930166 RepID=UPI000F470871|nr:hypothetical protein [Pseudomonas brassicacearum]ROM72138.1 hypothetical protein BK653_09735 [Pseudomonas brassicacearum]